MYTEPYLQYLPVRSNTVPRALKLHMELVGSNLAELEEQAAKDPVRVEDEKERIRLLQEYGKVKQAISRDVIVPSNLSLHEMDYLINQLFGWRHAHLHHYELPKDVQKNLFIEPWLENRQFYGTYLLFPSGLFADQFWDDDYKPEMDGKSWMQTKYFVRHPHLDFSNSLLENQAGLNDWIERCPVLRIHDFLRKEDQWVPIEKASHEQAQHYFLSFERPFDSLNERRTVEEILSKNPTKLYQIHLNLANMKTWKTLLPQYEDERQKITRNSNPGDQLDALNLMHNRPDLVEMVEEAEPIGLAPVASEIRYFYDFGDGWEVRIRVEEEYDRTTEDETVQKVMKSGRAICTAADGLNVIDDVGGIHGYAEYLKDFYEGEAQEKKRMCTWGRYMGWSSRERKPENIL